MEAGYPFPDKNRMMIPEAEQGEFGESTRA